MQRMFRTDAMLKEPKRGFAFFLMNFVLASSILATAAIAQDDEDEYEDEAPSETVAPATEGTGDSEASESSAEETPVEDSADAAPSEEEKANEARKAVNVAPANSAFVGAIDRLPAPGTPLIANKKHSMQYRLELGILGDISYSNRFVAHYGAHLSLGFHIFDWLAVEGIAGAMYPDEDSIVNEVRRDGLSASDGSEPRLAGLWQSLGYGAVGLQWAPLYGKISLASEIQLIFQFYLTGGAAVEAIAKVPQRTAVTTYDFYPGLIEGQNYEYQARFSAMYGAGVRLMPLEWMSIRLELRNLTGLNPAVPDYDELQFIDINNMPLINAGVSFLL